MIIKKFCLNDSLLSFYKTLFDNVFSDLDVKEGQYQIPSTLYVVYEDNKALGFVSGYLQSSIAFYIQYAGMMKLYRGIKTLSAFRLCLNEIAKEYPIITCAIKNINSPAIKLAINEGFIINGVRQDNRKTLYVELIRGMSWQT